MWSQFWRENIAILHVSRPQQVGQASVGHMLTQLHKVIIKVGLVEKRRAVPQEETQILISHFSGTYEALTKEN